MKKYLVYQILLCVKAFSRTFYRFKISWIGKIPRDPWADLRLVLILNHTSLYEPLFTGWVPNRFLRRVAADGLVPIADKTFCRPMVGRFFKFAANNVIPITRLRDRSWVDFFNRIRPESLVIMLPEGRMKRKNGLDSEGKPMTVRGGVADVLRSLPGGRMLIAYSGGLHHVQFPSQPVPKLFKQLQMRIECIDIRNYCRSILEKNGEQGFKWAVMQDLEKRRDRYCVSH